MNNTTNLTQTQKTLLDLLANALFCANRPIDEDADWASVCKEAYMQAVCAVAFSGVPVSSFEESIANDIKRLVQLSVVKNTRVSFEHSRLSDILKENSVDFTILKGCASASYYPDPILRAMGDVDFLIDEKDIEKTKRVLEENGVKSLEKSNDVHFVFANNAARFEMHFEPAGIPYGKPGEVCRKLFSDMIQCSEEKETDFGKMILPSVFHHGLTILLHTAHHLTGEGVGLRHLCDWAVFVGSLSDEEFCGLFEKAFKEIGLWEFACVLTKACIDYLGCPEKKWIGNPDEETAFQIILDIFEGGNFGQKDPVRDQQSLLVSSHGKNGVGKTSMVRQLFISMNDIVFKKWPWSRKFVLVLPLGWLFFGLRYMIRAALGKRAKVQFKDAKDMASKRIELYKKLNLFENTEGKKWKT